MIGTPTVADVTEDTAAPTLTAVGSISISDVDSGEAHFQTTVAGAAGNLGALVLAADGSYSYSVANADVQFLAGSNANGGTSTHVDTFTVTAADGTSQLVSFTIHGTNDAPTVSNLALTETSISFIASDIDNPTLSLASPFAAAFGSHSHQRCHHDSNPDCSGERGVGYASCDGWQRDSGGGWSLPRYGRQRYRHRATGNGV